MNFYALYLAFYGRAPDVAGLHYWQHIQTQHPTEVILSVFASPEQTEFANIFGKFWSVEAVIHRAFQQLFDRTLDVHRLDTWMTSYSNNVSQGMNPTLAVSDVVNKMINGATGQDLATLNHKTSFSVAVHQWLTEHPILDHYPALGGEGIKALYQAIGSEPKSLTAALEAFPSIFKEAYATQLVEVSLPKFDIHADWMTVLYPPDNDQGRLIKIEPKESAVFQLFQPLGPDDYEIALWVFFNDKDIYDLRSLNLKNHDIAYTDIFTIGVNQPEFYQDWNGIFAKQNSSVIIERTPLTDYFRPDPSLDFSVILIDVNQNGHLDLNQDIAIRVPLTLPEQMSPDQFWF